MEITKWLTLVSMGTGEIAAVAIVTGILLTVGLIVIIMQFYRKVEQGTAIIRNGVGGTKVSFGGIVIVPILHIAEIMDISVKRVVISRRGKDGLICKDNMRADVDVAFFVRVNKTDKDVMAVAESLGCVRASTQEGLVELFDAKFSEALKTVGKHFDFVELYDNRDTFKTEILKVIGTDLNGYHLEDAAIDYLEQTPVELLNPDNILDAEGIKKITDLTAQQAKLANGIRRDKERVIKKQDVETREAILQLERQQVDAEQKQSREIAEVTAREQAEARRVEQENRLKAERARIASDEEIAVATENKDRQIVIARKNKERAEKVETERVEKDRALEQTERERVVSLSQIERDKAIEVEKKNIQDVIRERVSVERTVVEQEERIKDTREFAGADRAKKVAVTQASQDAEREKVKRVVSAEAEREAAKFAAEQIVIEAEAQRTASEKEAAARKIIADAKAQEEAVLGMGEARALEAKAHATEQFGTAEAVVVEKKALAEATGMKAKAEGAEKQGFVEAEVMHKKYTAEANGIREKAEAMKLFNEAGKEHEEFKLSLNKDLQVELAGIKVRESVAKEQAAIVGQALKSARIDIVGGESEFFDKIVGSIAQGKSVDRMIDSSKALSLVKDTFFTGDPAVFKHQLKRFASQFGVTSEDLKNLTVSALLAKMTTAAGGDSATAELIGKLADSARELGLGEKAASAVLGK